MLRISEMVLHVVLPAPESSLNVITRPAYFSTHPPGPPAFALVRLVTLRGVPAERSHAPEPAPDLRECQDLGTNSQRDVVLQLASPSRPSRPSRFSRFSPASSRSSA